MSLCVIYHKTREDKVGLNKASDTMYINTSRVFDSFLGLLEKVPDTLLSVPVLRVVHTCMYIYCSDMCSVHTL